MSNINLKAKKRNTETPATKLKSANLLPAVVYGPNLKNISVQIDYRDFDHVFKQAGESTLIDLLIDGSEAVKVLIKDVQADPVSDKFIHADFYQLDMNKKLTVDVELNFLNIEEVEKATGGEVIKNMDKIEVECLPKDLVKKLDVDLVEHLKAIGDVFQAGDVKLTEGLKLVVTPESPIASLQEIVEEVIEENPTEKPENEEGVSGEEKKEEEETAPAEGGEENKGE